MERTCGSCRFFKVTRERDDSRLGTCRLEKLMGVFRDSMRACPSFSIHGDPDPPVVIDAGRKGASRRRVSGGNHPGAPGPGRVSSAALAAVAEQVGPDGLKAAIHDAFASVQGLSQPELGRQWATGTLELAPSDAALKSKSLELEVYFHKLVMIRDNLRVFEQKVNSQRQLHDSEKIDLQCFITLAYEGVVDMGSGWMPRSIAPDPGGHLCGLLHELAFEMRWSTLTRPAPGMGVRWEGGEARYIADEVRHVEPVERFYYRLMILRDRLMSLEAVVSAHPHIGPDDATAMGGYLRRCYGSLTTFNVLIHDRTMYFGSGK